MDPQITVTSAPLDMELAELLGEKPSDFIILYANGEPVPFFGTPYDSPSARDAQRAFVDSINDKSKASRWPEFYMNWCGHFDRHYKLPPNTNWKTFHPEFSWAIHRVAHGYSEHLHAAVGLFGTLGNRVKSWGIYRGEDGGCIVELVSARGVAYSDRGQEIPRLIATVVARLLTCLKASS